MIESPKEQRFLKELRRYANGSDDEVSIWAVDAAIDYIYEMYDELKESREEVEDVREYNETLLSQVTKLSDKNLELAAQVTAYETMLDFLEDEARQEGGILLHNELQTGRRGIGLLNRTLTDTLQTMLAHRSKGRH